MEETQLIESRQLRDKMSGRFEVLEKVKELLLLPDTDLMSINQVAYYYEVTPEWIKELYGNHREEVDSDGTKLLPRAFYDGSKLKPTSVKERAQVAYSFDDGQTVTINNRGLKAFSKRAVLRLGMMLQQSDVAQRVRTALLDIEERSDNSIKTKDIDTEEGLMMSVGMAVASGDATAVAIATAKMIEFKNRHIAKLEKDNKALAGNILDWGDKKRLNAGIRKLAAVTGIPFGKMWSELYKELQYKHGICLKTRNSGKKPWIDNVKENEWNDVMKTFCAMCEAYEQSPSEMFQKTVPELV